MEEKIAITCDSSLDLSPDLIKEYNIKVLSMVIKMDGAEYLDIEEAAPDDILGYHDRTGELAVTSAPTM
ncbi:MAG: DegV family protein [Oscillospiraceae bacterium]|nr:DegV family protein [Oscillospiraceae bacterium]